MEKTSPVSKKRVARKPLPKAVNEQPPNKYSVKDRIGQNKPVGKPANYVTRVGLGNLTTITANGNDNV